MYVRVDYSALSHESDLRCDFVDAEDSIRYHVREHYAEHRRFLYSALLAPIVIVKETLRKFTENLAEMIYYQLEIFENARRGQLSLALLQQRKYQEI